MKYLTVVSVISDGETYAGTVADFASSDPLIYRDKRPLRTDKFELKQLNGEFLKPRTRPPRHVVSY